MGGLSPSPFCVVVMKVTARSRPAKGWPCLMKTDEAEIKCLPTLRDSFITVSPRAIEHLGLELSFNRPCLTAPWWHAAAFQAHEHLHLYLSFSLIRSGFLNALTDTITLYISVCHPQIYISWSDVLTVNNRKRFKATFIKSKGFGSPCGTSITAPWMLTHVGSTAIRS